MAGEAYSYVWHQRCIVAETAEAEAAADRLKASREQKSDNGTPARKFDMDAALEARRRRAERKAQRQAAREQRG